MKRSREEEDAPMACSYQSPQRSASQRGLWANGALVNAAATAEITPTKRQRGRSIPMDAMSRLMTAATSAARMKKRAQMTLTSLFGGSRAVDAPMATVAMGSCAVCPATATAKVIVPRTELHRCAHCERMTGACCSRECDGCAGVFCSHCSTINCDEQFDRVFCLSCNYDLSR